jgi:hypothetical protein
MILTVKQIEDRYTKLLIFLSTDKWCESDVAMAVLGLGRTVTIEILNKMTGLNLLVRYGVKLDGGGVNYIYGITIKGLHFVGLTKKSGGEVFDPRGVTGRTHFAHKKFDQFTRAAYMRAGATNYCNTLMLAKHYNWTKLVPDGFCEINGRFVSVEIELSPKTGIALSGVLTRYCEKIYGEFYKSRKRVDVVYYSDTAENVKRIKNSLNTFKKPIEFNGHSFGFQYDKFNGVDTFRGHFHVLSFDDPIYIPPKPPQVQPPQVQPKPPQVQPPQVQPKPPLVQPPLVQPKPPLVQPPLVQPKPLQVQPQPLKELPDEEIERLLDFGFGLISEIDESAEFDYQLLAGKYRVAILSGELPRDIIKTHLFDLRRIAEIHGDSEFRYDVISGICETCVCVIEAKEKLDEAKGIKAQPPQAQPPQPLQVQLQNTKNLISELIPLAGIPASNKIQPLRAMIRLGSVVSLVVVKVVSLVAVKKNGDIRMGFVLFMVFVLAWCALYFARKFGWIGYS